VVLLNLLFLPFLALFKVFLFTSRFGLALIQLALGERGRTVGVYTLIDQNCLLLFEKIWRYTLGNLAVRNFKYFKTLSILIILKITPLLVQLRLHGPRYAYH